MQRAKLPKIKEHRGIPLIGIWGVHTGLSYQRPEWKQISIDQLKQDAIDFFTKYGANIVELYPSNKESHFDDYTCKENVAVPLHLFREYPDFDQENVWTINEFLEFNRYAHKNDFLISLMIHCWWLASYEYRAKVFWKLLHELGIKVNDISVDGFGQHIDGFATEGDFIVPEEANDLLWIYHPGIYLRESAWGIKRTTGNYIQPRGFHLTDGRVLMYEREEYMGLAPECWRGWEKIWRGEEIKLKGGKLYVSLQAEGRDVKCSDKRWAVYGGMGSIDMLIEEVNNYARAKARSWSTAGTTAIRVINEPLLSPKMKRYVGGICQDPIRCAISATLDNTAKDGRYPRTNYPKGTSFIQNNFYRAYIAPDGQVDLHYDKNAEANFTNFVWQTSGLLLSNFIKSRFDKNQKLTFNECEAREEAGAVAVLRQRCTYRANEISMDEFRDYKAEADNPWLWIKIQRVFVGNDAIARSAISIFDFKGYKPPQKPAVDKAIILTSKNKPKLALFVPKSEDIYKLEWDRTGKLKIISTENNSHNFRIALLIGVPENITPTKLTKQIRFLSEELRFDMDNGLTKELIVKSTIDTEVVRSVLILNPPNGLYQVCEKGWWQVRGGQPSWDIRGTDLIKIVLSPGDTARIQSYNFIDGIVKSGWGCQYTQLIRDIVTDENKAKLTVRVIDINPKIWAPRLHFARRISSAKVDGKEWFYFNGPFLFLPNRWGNYEIEVDFGRPNLPHLICTFAIIEKTIWKNNSLIIKTNLPEWTDTLLPEENYYLILDAENYKLTDIKNAKIIRTIPNFSEIKPTQMTGKDNIATLIPREYNHPPLSGFKNANKFVLSFKPPTEIRCKFNTIK